MTSAADVFDAEAERYDGWFETPAGRILFANELAAVRLLWRDEFRPALEVGVGTGRFAAALGVQYGIDPARGALRLAAARGIEVTCGSGEALPYADRTFAAVVMIATLCFAADVSALFREAARVLRPDGRLLIGDIPADSPWGQHYLRQKAAGHRFFQHAQFYTMDGLTRLLATAGFTVEAAASTLLTPPDQPPTPEAPQSGMVVDAGFVCVLCASGRHGP